MTLAEKAKYGRHLMDYLNFMVDEGLSFDSKITCDSMSIDDAVRLNSSACCVEPNDRGFFAKPFNRHRDTAKVTNKKAAANRLNREWKAGKKVVDDEHRASA